MTIGWRWLLPATFALGCEQVLDVDAYVTDDGESTVTSTSTITTGGSNEGGAGGMGGDALVAAGPDCYHGEETVHLEPGYEIHGYQNRCSEAQLAELESCWSTSFNCPFYAQPENQDCTECVVGTDSPPIIPVLLEKNTALIYVQVYACEAVAQNKEHCIEAIELEFCRNTSCEICGTKTEDNVEYNQCMDFSELAGCSDIEVPADCESLFTDPSFACNASFLDQRAVKTARVLCGPPG